jgi:hypothetical protein
MIARTGIVLAALAATALPRAAAADAVVRLANGPYTTGITDTSVEIRFEFAAAAPARVELRSGAPGAKAVEIPDASPATMHVVVADHLAPSTTYSYVVRAGAGAVADGRFTTAPAAGSHDPVRFIAYGDNRTAPDVHAAVVQAIRQVPSDFLVNTGDMVADGGDPADWRAFFSIEAPLLRERPLLVAVGNHELRNDSAGDSFVRYFGFPGGTPAAPRLYGTVRTGMARFFFLNAWHDWRSGEEREWLTHALDAADGEADLVWRIAVVHQAPWSVGPHGPNRNLVEAGVPALLAAHKVDLMLAGHDHIYDRGDAGRVKYVLTGGGGAPLYDIAQQDPTSRKAEASFHFVEIAARDDALQIVAHRVDGSLIETCGFPKGKPWDCDPPPKAEVPALPFDPPRGSAAAPRTDSRCACGVVGRGANETVGRGAAANETVRRSATHLPWALAALIAMGAAMRRARRRG